MVAISDNFDLKIRVIFPNLTKSLSDDDSERINATGNFNFEPPPQVDTAQGDFIGRSPVKERETGERVEILKTDLKDIIKDLGLIKNAMKRRARNIVLKYDPELAESEILANAELAIFGSQQGSITYDQFLATVEYQRKINKYISHLSIENEGIFSGVS